MEEGDDRAGPTVDPGHYAGADAPKIQVCADRHPGGKQWVEGPCPTVGCGGTFTLENVWGFLQPVAGKEPRNPLCGEVRHKP